MEFFIIIVLAVLGAAFIAGGIVGYRKSESARAKAISAAAVESLAIVRVKVPELKQSALLQLPQVLSCGPSFY